MHFADKLLYVLVPLNYDIYYVIFEKCVFIICAGSTFANIRNYYER